MLYSEERSPLAPRRQSRQCVDGFLALLSVVQVHYDPVGAYLLQHTFM